MALRIDPVAYWSGRNRYLSVACGLVIASIGFVWMGPPAARLEVTRSELREREARFERWQENFRRYHPISEAERTRWEQQFGHLRTWLPEVADEAAQIAEVARLFELPSTQDLEVQAGKPLGELELGLEPEWSLESPIDGRVLDIRAIPLKVSFECDYEDLARLFDQIERKLLPLYLEEVRLRRVFAGVQVRLDIVIFLRQGELA